MNARPLAALFLALPVLYALARLLAVLPAGDAGAWVAIVLLAIVAAMLARPEKRSRIAGYALLAFLLLGTALAGAFAGDPGLALGAGVVVGLPLLTVAVAARSGEPAGVRVLAFGAALTWELLLLPALPSGPWGSEHAAPFLSNLGTDLADQFSGLVGLLTRTSVLSLPAHATFDPVFVGFVGLAILGLLLIAFQPESGQGEPLPTATRRAREDEGARDLPTQYAFGDAQRAAFRERSLVEPALSAWPPGLVPIGAGALGAAVFAVAAAVEPAWSLLGVAVGVLVTVLVLFAAAGPGPRSSPGAPEPLPAPSPTPESLGTDEPAATGAAGPPVDRA